MNSQVARLQHSEPLTLTQYTDKTLRDISDPFRNLLLDGIKQAYLNQGELVVLTDQPEPRINGVYRISKLHDNKKNTPFVLKKIAIEKGKSCIIHITDGTHKGATLLCSARDGDICVVKPIGEPAVKRSASKKLVKTTSMQKLKIARSTSSSSLPSEPVEVAEPVQPTESVQLSVQQTQQTEAPEKFVSLQEEIVSLQEQMLNTRHLDKLRTELVESQEKLAANDREMADLLSKNQIKSKELEERLAKKRAAEERLAELEKQVGELDKTIDHKRNLEELENLLAAKKKLLADLDAKLALADDASELQRSIKSQEDQISSKRKRLSMLVAELSNEDLSVKKLPGVPEPVVEVAEVVEVAVEKTESPDKVIDKTTDKTTDKSVDKPKKKKGLAGIFAKISKKKKPVKSESSESVDKSVTEPITEPVDKSVTKPVDKLVTEPVNMETDNVSTDYIIESIPKAEVVLTAQQTESRVVTQLTAVESYKDFIDRAHTETTTQVEETGFVAPVQMRSAEFVMVKRQPIKSSEAFYICKLSTVTDNIGCVGLSSGGLEVSKTVQVCFDMQYSGLNCQVSLYVDTGKGKNIIPLPVGVTTVGIQAGSVVNFRCTPKINGKMYDIDSLKAVLTVTE